MLSAFFDAAKDRITDRWAAILVPALLFWGGAMLAWAYGSYRWQRLTIITELIHSQNAAAQIAVALSAVVVVVVSAVVVQALTNPVLRLLEGYWPPPVMKTIGVWKVKRIAAGRACEATTWQQLQQRAQDGALSAAQRRSLGELERRRRYRPVLDDELMPTRIGNTLRAAETRPAHRYGLEAVVVWPRLWLVMPDTARQEIATARGSLDSSVAVAIWGVGFICLSSLAWWAAPLGAMIAVLAVIFWIPVRAEVFAELVEGCFDLYRTALYTQLRWPVPKTPAKEQDAGQNLTRYLARGSDANFPVFTPSI